jgi:hypothetical protein
MTDQDAALTKLVASSERDPVVLQLARIIVAVEGRRRVVSEEDKHAARSADLTIESTKR